MHTAARCRRGGRAQGGPPGGVAAETACHIVSASPRTDQPGPSAAARRLSSSSRASIRCCRRAAFAWASSRPLAVDRRRSSCAAIAAAAASSASGLSELSGLSGLSGPDHGWLLLRLRLRSCSRCVLVPTPHRRAAALAPLLLAPRPSSSRSCCLPLPPLPPLDGKNSGGESDGVARDA